MLGFGAVIQVSSAQMSITPDPDDLLSRITPVSPLTDHDRELQLLSPERRREERRKRNMLVTVDRRRANRRATQLQPDSTFKGVAVILDDTPLFAEGVCSVVRPMGLRVEPVGPAFEDIAAHVGDRLDLVIVGQSEVDVATLAERLRALPGRPGDLPPFILVMLTQLDPAQLRKLLSRGIPGIIERSATAEDMRTAVARLMSGERVLSGRPLAVLASTGLNPTPDELGVQEMTNPLTPKEMEVLAKLATHGTNWEIAGSLHVSEATVKTHLASIYHKLEVPGRREAVLVAVERGLLQ